jgi:crossover junction endodeoxyribonuclease RuvC
VRVLGIDTSLRSTGFGVVEPRGGRLAAVELGRIRSADDLPRSQCLLRLGDGVRQVIARTRPEAVAVEGVFFFRNVRTSVVLGEVRGVVIAECVRAGLPVFEYPPRRVKLAVAGYGGASKEQIRRMVMALLGLNEAPQEDAGDALAIAICHLNSRSGHAALAPQPI